MQQKSSKSASEDSALKRIERIRRKIVETDYVCSGTIVTTMNTCGKTNCRCATDPSARHGPYHQWNRMKQGKLIHTTVNAEQAQQLRQAIKNYRAILHLLRDWELETAKVFDVKHRPK